MASHPLALFLFVAVFAIGNYSRAERPQSSDQSRADSTAVARTAARFHEALMNGDSATIERLVASDLRVLEGGEVENKAQYLSHHLAADIEFARAVRGERSVVSYTRQGNVAWLVSTSTAAGNFNSRDINSVGAELMILSRARGGWQIRAVHWSSQRIQPR
ncbi:MAG TPA: nuclear transport factor 2 family protein [Gemmatimonadaceae bacterium]|jgi:ketosteroid isomerase-like protein